MNYREGEALSESDLPALAIGAAILGTGGGGNPYIGMLRTRELIRKGGTIRVLPLDALPDDVMVGRVGGIGAPLIGIERFAQGEETLRALRAVEAASATKMSALIAAEIGGANAMAPMIVAAQSGLPVLDGDGMGRAFPEVQMTTFSIYGAKNAPTALSDANGNVVVLAEIVDMFAQERFARTITVQMGAAAGAAGAPLPMSFVRRAAVPGTVTLAKKLGDIVLAARARHQNVVERIVEAAGARLSFVGKIVDVQRELKGGFVRGIARVSGLDRWGGSEARIAIQNENLVLWVDGEPALMVPDLIMNLALDNGEPITTEMLRYGQRIAIIGLPAHDLLKTPQALKIVGPAAFGYPDLTYVPLADSRRAA